MEEQQEGGYHHKGLKQAVIDMSLAIVEESGHEDLSLRDVAERCGVSRSAPYKHFKDKNELLLEIAITGFDRLAKAQKKILAKAGSNQAESLKALCMSYVSFAVEHQNLYHLMYAKSLSALDSESRLTIAKMKTLMWVSTAINNEIIDNPVTVKTQELVTGHLWAHVHGLTLLVLETTETKGRLSKQATDFVQASIDLLFLGLTNDKSLKSPDKLES